MSTFETGNYVESRDERDDPTEVFIVVETGIDTVSGLASKIRPTGSRTDDYVYRLDAHLTRVGIEWAAYRLGA